MMQRFLLIILLAAATTTTGCGDRQPPATLVVHYNGGLYDFIDHDGRLMHTSKDLDDFKLAIRKTKIQNLIVGSRVVVRFAGVRSGNGLDVPEELVPAIAELAGVGATKQDFDYTND